MNDEKPLQTRVSSVLEDPSVEAIARLYAVSLLDAAQNKNSEHIAEELHSFITDVLDRHPRWEEIISSQIVSRDDKLGLIDRVVKPAGSEILTNFLRVLAQHDRLGLVRTIDVEVAKEVQRRLGQKTVHVISASPLPDQSVQYIQARLGSQLPFEPILDLQVDPTLLGGLVIQVGDSVFDSSLRSRMNQMRVQLRERYLNEIQSGRDRFGHSEGN